MSIISNNITNTENYDAPVYDARKNKKKDVKKKKKKKIAHLAANMETSFENRRSPNVNKLYSLRLFSVIIKKLYNSWRSS